MLTREQLIKFNMENPPVKPLVRSCGVQSDYDSFINKSNNRTSFINEVKAVLSKCGYHFVPNDFPYHTTPNIEHWVCWYGRDTTPQEIIKKLGLSNSIITYWRNSAENRSIAEISHIHVFIERK